jgi:type II restriction enzyme
MSKRINVTAEDIYNALVRTFGIINAEGQIHFQLKDFDILVRQNSVVGNVIEEWLANWFDANNFSTAHNLGQDAPDFWLGDDPVEYNTNWLEVKSFTESPNFDIANFRSYISEVIAKPWKLHSKYLCIKYSTYDGIINIDNVWLKSVWQISCPSKKWSVKCQNKRGTIYNLRPSTWYSERTDYPTFKSLEHFISALEETIYCYRDTHSLAESWKNQLLKSYDNFYHKSLVIPRWFDIKADYGL